jgi:1-acyl-sn-glycerol-3-phosphate acyltransferase
LNSTYSSRLTRIFRSCRLALHLLLGFCVALIILPIASATQRDFIIGAWSRGLLTALDIRLVSYGTLPDDGLSSTMFVANHVSWIDIFALNSVHTLRFIAKSEIRSWPLLGWLCEKGNTLFIERSKRQDVSRMVELTADRLRAGDNLCFFPEGATSDGAGLKPFKGSLMQAAIDAESSIWPVAIRYPKPGGGVNTEMAYFDDMSLLQSLKQVLAQRSPVVELHFLPVIATRGLDRRSLSVLARQAITAGLNL